LHTVSSDLKGHDDADRMPLPHAGDKARDAVGVPLPLSLEVRQLDLAYGDLLEQFAEGDIRAFERHGVVLSWIFGTVPRLRVAWYARSEAPAIDNG
jgi:hypothetical protein